MLLATAIGMVAALFGTRWAIGVFHRIGIGQPIREDGPTTHLVKRGTPTMGGLVLLIAATVAYAGGHVRLRGWFDIAVQPFAPAGLLVLGAAWALGIVGAFDDVIKVRHRRSLGLNKRWKLFGQAVVGFGLAFAATEWIEVPSRISITGAKDLLPLPQVLFALWILVLIAAASNAVNLTDGLDGLACGSSAMSLFVFMIIAFWEARNKDVYAELRPLEPNALIDVAVVAGALLGACIGFLWWNAIPARIIMGDTGALALGGALAALALFTQTQLLLPVIGGLFVIETVSVMLQVVSYRLFNKRRVFAMAPLHHHFEIRGWQEATVIVRFWLLAALSAGLGLALFYYSYLIESGIGGV